MNRANLLLIDEFRMVSKDVIDTILRKFLTLRRMPRYASLTKEQRKQEYAREKNRTIYLSSAYFADHWSYTKCIDTCKFMLSDTKNQFVCGLPYQLSISEGLLDEDTVADEMAESDFNEIKFSMEYAAMFYGNTDGSFFDFNSVSKNRRIKYPMLPKSVAQLLNNDKRLKIPAKRPGEKRILSADIALMSSKKSSNDATAIFINQMIPSKSGRYSNNIVFCHTVEGAHTEDQALTIRRLYEEFECDYIVIDTMGVGLGVFDILVRDIVDRDTGEIYPALSCCNDPAMAERCTVRGAEKVIWSIKANPVINSEAAVMLREGFKSGKVRLLQTEYDGESSLGEIKGFSSLSPAEKTALSMPYIQTTLLIDEMVKLKHEESGGRVKLTERTGMRKDRYSSLSYNYYVACQIESKTNRRKDTSSEFDDIFVLKAPRQTHKGRW